MKRKKEAFIKKKRKKERMFLKIQLGPEKGKNNFKEERYGKERVNE